MSLALVKGLRNMLFRRQLPPTRHARVIAIIVGGIIGIVLAVVIATSVFPIEIRTQTATALDSSKSNIGEVELIGPLDEYYKAYRVRVDNGLGYYFCLVVVGQKETSITPASVSCH